jgi:hypothetical protein
MFDSEGNWKEFSLTLSEKHTWFPFWLFCILWAILSYAIISYFFDEPEKSKSRTVSSKKVVENMKPGYYVLDKNATKKEGIPRYVYLGSENPEDLNHSLVEDE